MLVFLNPCRFSRHKVTFLLKEWGKKAKLGELQPFWNAELYLQMTPRDDVSWLNGVEMSVTESQY